MGCFLACFRARNSCRFSPPLQEAPESQSLLSSLFSPKDVEDSSCEETADFSVGSALIDKELKYEAKFLKACGTIPETPPEIRKASGKFKSQDVDSYHFDIASFPNQKAMKKLQLGEYPDQSSSPVQVHGEEAKYSYSPHYSFSRMFIGSNNSNSPDSVKPAVQSCVNQDDDIIVPVSPWNPDTNVQQRSKSVRFLCDVDATPSSSSSSEYDSRDSKKFETPVNQNISKPSPNPTPLNLSNDMQTPGTVYPSTLEKSVNGKVRIRSQFVYPIQNHVETAFRWRVPNDLDDELSNESPMCWEGNGIPNSTHKYKEDQKVSWHATPFEERLEKVLSNAVPIPQRKPILSTTTLFKGNEENGTESPSLDSAARPEPAVSW